MFPTLHFHTSKASFFCSENPASGYAHTEENEIIEVMAYQLDHLGNHSRLPFPGTCSTSARQYYYYLAFGTTADSFNNFHGCLPPN